jgi:dTMP kinase
MSSGRFIIFEGPHGSGKTTYARSVVRLLKRQGQPVWYTHEPFLPQVRLLTARYVHDMDMPSGYALLFLHATDRMVHSRLIQDKREKGVWVMCDRYLPSSYVYQQMQGISLPFIEKCNEFCLEPDTTLFFSLPVDERVRRLRRGKRLRQSAFLTPAALDQEESLYGSIFAHCRRRWQRVFRFETIAKQRDVLEAVRRVLAI